MKNITLLLFTVLMASSVFGASIWKNAQNGKRLELFTSEEKVWKRHDLVRVQIIENTTALHEDETDIKKDTSFASKVSAWFKWDFGLSKPIQAKTLPSVGYSSNKAFKADASIDKSSTFKGEITAEVLEVMPNGNLVISAKKEIHLGNDVQHVRFTGVVMPRDINKDNEIVSSRVADAKIVFGGTGAVTEAQKEGLISRLFNKFWVF